MGPTEQSAEAPSLNEAAPRLAYSVKRFCDETSIGKTMFYALVKAGKIRLTKIGTRSIITGGEVMRFLKEGAE
jgi:hypothetical protein